MTSGSRLSLFLPQGVSLLELGKPVRADTLASSLQTEIQKFVVCCCDQTKCKGQDGSVVMEGGRYLQRADLASLRRVFNKYSSLNKDGVAYLSYEDLIVRWAS